MDRAALKARILAAVKKAKARGIAIKPKLFGVQAVGDRWELELGPQCCPLAAVVLEDQPETYSDDDEYRKSIELGIMDALGVSNEWRDGFVGGFDGDAFEGNEKFFDPDGYELGADIRREILDDPTAPLPVQVSKVQP